MSKDEKNQESKNEEKLFLLFERKVQTKSEKSEEQRAMRDERRGNSREGKAKSTDLEWSGEQRSAQNEERGAKSGT